MLKETNFQLQTVILQKTEGNKNISDEETKKKVKPGLGEHTLNSSNLEDQHRRITWATSFNTSP